MELLITATEGVGEVASGEVGSANESRDVIAVLVELIGSKPKVAKSELTL